MSRTAWEKQKCQEKGKTQICWHLLQLCCTTSAVPSSMALHVAWTFLHGPVCLSAATLQCQIPVSLTEDRVGSSSHKMMPSLYSATDADSDPCWFLTVLISILLQVLEKAPGCSSQGQMEQVPSQILSPACITRLLWDQSEQQDWKYKYGRIKQCEERLLRSNLVL